MCAKIIAVATSKGGGGKTTLAVGIAAQLANDGVKTLLVDFDPQASATLSLGLTPFEPRSVSRWMLGEDVEMDELVIDIHANLKLLAGHESVMHARAEFEDAVNEAKTQTEKIEIMIALGEMLRASDYDVVVLDTPADNILREACVLAADVVVSPVPAAQADIEGFSLFVGQANSLFDMVGTQTPIMVVINKIDDRHKRGRENLDKIIREVEGADVLFSVAGTMHQSVAITDSFGDIPIPLQPNSRRNRRARTEFKNIADKIMDKLETNK